MSEGPPQGGGWWQASDGLWYPPETHPSLSAGGPPTGEIQVDRTPPEGIPRYGPAAGRPPEVPPVPRPGPGPTPPLPPPRRSRSGCLVAFLVVVGIVALAVIALGAIANQLRQDARDAYERTIGQGVSRVQGIGKCDFVSGAEARAALGDSRVVGLGDLGSTAVPQLDTRVLPEARACMIVAADGRLARVARQQSGHPRALFDAEVAKARAGTSPYYESAVRGLRDQAFCTGLDGSGASGVLLRRGDVLVYASLTPDLSHNPGGIDKLGARVAADNCRTAQILARDGLT
jgi:hypothetical protein